MAASIPVCRLSEITLHKESGAYFELSWAHKQSPEVLTCWRVWGNPPPNDFPFLNLGKAMHFQYFIFYLLLEIGWLKPLNLKHNTPKLLLIGMSIRTRPNGNVLLYQ